MFHHYRRLIELRHTSAVVVDGDFTMLLADHPHVYAFTRSLGAETLLVAGNFSGEHQPLDGLDDLDDWAGAEVVHRQRRRSGADHGRAAAVGGRRVAAGRCGGMIGGWSRRDDRSTTSSRSSPAGAATTSRGRPGARSASSTTAARPSTTSPGRPATMYLHENALNTAAFPSLARIQSDVVRWTADLLHGPPTARRAS